MNNEEIKIEKGIPFPIRNGKNGKSLHPICAAMLKMEVGDSITVSHKMPYGLIWRHSKARGGKFMTKRIGNGQFRIWKTSL